MKNLKEIGKSWSTRVFKTIYLNQIIFSKEILKLPDWSGYCPTTGFEGIRYSKIILNLRKMSNTREFF